MHYRSNDEQEKVNEWIQLLLCYNQKSHVHKFHATTSQQLVETVEIVEQELSCEFDCLKMGLAVFTLWCYTM